MGGCFFKGIVLVLGSTDSISVVIAAWNEQPSLAPLLEELVPILREIDRPFEVLLVDDGSTDGSAETLQDLGLRIPELRAILLPRHRGKADALLEGFEQARGAWVVTLDADLQDEPREIPRLLRHAGDDVLVIGIRRRADTRWRRLLSGAARCVHQAVLRDSASDIGCPVRIVPRVHLAGLPRFEGLHRFLPALLEARGVRIVQCPVSHRPRRYGRSRYRTLERLASFGIHLPLVWRWTRRERSLAVASAPPHPETQPVH